ncbi:GNAT family N-acetyltransferase [Psychromonas sp. Urea-02u-13]|uniref:GNAT family N-acetyltransferase n=1 Tax=Psychromonas sp. Urea-02u-13 TaxID=2058326 RepID=UPI000C3376F1|nr:GNAT family N-acetyltransferase [Psychromonas sp. Urea-02u-13]PKG40746.1 GNAT family N-acetyltransferase [Psychromonas sp. Urea-02u-13]
MFTIVQADLTNESHASAYLALMSHYACDPMGGGEDLADFAKQNLVSTLLKRNDVVILLIFKENEPAALLTAIEGFSTFACKPLFNIHDVAVHENFRGLKLTTLLFAEIEKIARDRDYCKITLEVLSGNEVAKNAYIKQGYADYQLDPAHGSALFWSKSLKD